jgi:hypothetical protein
MKAFPTAIFQPEPGLIGPHPLEGLFIRVPLKPFDWNGAHICTAFRWDYAQFSGEGLAALSGASFSFERKETDASIYIDGAHHPVDVLKVAFESVNDGYVKADFHVEIDFSHEGLEDFGPSPWSFTCLLHWTDQAQPA